MIHWNTSEAGARIKQIENLGHTVIPMHSYSHEFMRKLAENPPDAVVIDLSRLPSHGREAAMELRNRKSLRQTPIIFADGVDEKIERIKLLFPDAIYRPWARIGAALSKALKQCKRD